ncbi:MAG: hypothetical protein WA364_26005 [Candidatus Nitrosopolaris sp.]
MTWIIVEHQEFNKTIKAVPKRIRQQVEKLRVLMVDNPFVNGADESPLQNKCKGLFEQKIDNYRLVYRTNLNAQRVEFLWIRAKPHATARRWVK